MFIISFVCCLHYLFGLSSSEKDVSSSSFTAADNQFYYSSIINNANLSILFIHSIFPAHFFPLVALGAELVERGHQVTTLGPTVEGYEHLPKLAESHGMKFISTEFTPRWVYDLMTQSGKHNDNVNFLTFMANMTYMMFNLSKNDDIVKNVKNILDKMNNSDYDYIVSDFASASLMYYVQKTWHTSKIMLVVTSIPMLPSFIIPWPYPKLFSPFTDNMSFYDRFLSTVVYYPIEKIAFLLFSLLLKIDKQQSVYDFSEVILTHPVLINTVIGFDWPKTILPLQHYIGPMLLETSPPLDSSLSHWLSKHSPNTDIIYISMGTTGEVNDIMAKAFTDLSQDYVIVWSLRHSNRDILKGLTINENRVYISSWISQFTMLQHDSVVMAIMHCGITSVQEALYHSIPVICFPSAFDQFDTGLRLESQGLGIQLIPKKVTGIAILKAVHEIRKVGYNEQVRKVSRLLRAGGGAKKGADLVELYADIGHDHGIPSFIRYKWNFIQYYNIDVWLVIVGSVIMIIWCCCKFCGHCFCKCCSSNYRKTKRD